jgi:Protein of unknown function (DUF2849)
VKLLTGNDLKTGAVTWWDGAAWSLRVEDAVDVGAEGQAILERESTARRVNAAYLIDADLKDGSIRPAHIKERIRALGPTVRIDLTLKPGDAAAAQQVI